LENNLNIIQPYLHLAFRAFPNAELSSPCGVHIYDASRQNSTDIALPQSIDIVPSASCVWIIAYNAPSDARFICIGSQSEKIAVEIGNFRNYFIAVFEDSHVYFKKNEMLTPADIADKVDEFMPDSASPDGKFISDLLECDDTSSRADVFMDFLSMNCRPYGFGSDLANMRTLIYEADGDFTVNELADETGYSVRHINRLFNENYGFGPKDFCRRLRFQHALREIFSNPNRQISEFIQNIGYSDQAHFQREFKTFMGETPRQFARKVNDVLFELRKSD
jgi:AraC-like DNA-binding protein